MEKLYKKALLAMMAIIMAVSFTACGDDDDDAPRGFGDYYTQYELVDKGTCTEAQAQKLILALNQTQVGQYWKNVYQEEAVKLFDDENEELALQIRNGLLSDVIGSRTVTIKFNSLLRVKDSDYIVKRVVFDVKQDDVRL